MKIKALSWFLFYLICSVHLLGQNAMDVPTISLPSNACLCSDEEMSRYLDLLNDLKAPFEEKARQVENQMIDKGELIEHALERTPYNQSDLDKLANSNENEQLAYAMQLAQQYMKNPQQISTSKQQEDLHEQFGNIQNESNNMSTLTGLLMPTALEISKLKKEAISYYKSRISPLEEKLGNMSGGPPAEALKKKIKNEKIIYCKKFTPHYHALLLQQIEACKKADPAMADYLISKSDHTRGLDVSGFANIDLMLEYLSIHEEAFEFRLVSPDE